MARNDNDPFHLSCLGKHCRTRNTSVVDLIRDVFSTHGIRVVKFSIINHSVTREEITIEITNEHEIHMAKLLAELNQKFMSEEVTYVASAHNTKNTVYVSRF